MLAIEKRKIDCFLGSFVRPQTLAPLSSPVLNLPFFEPVPSEIQRDSDCFGISSTVLLSPVNYKRVVDVAWLVAAWWHGLACQAYRSSWFVIVQRQLVKISYNSDSMSSLPRFWTLSVRSQPCRAKGNRTPATERSSRCRRMQVVASGTCNNRCHGYSSVGILQQ